MQNNDLVSRLLEKSQEAFIMGIEIYNKPTIHYRVEGFAFFICNAWELMLKARMMQMSGEASIYYKDNPERTITLENCIQKIFTNKKDPLRINLERIIDLRNISTHFITEEYEQIYVPLFQSCVLNYINKLLDFFQVDITEKISANFMTLSVKLSDIVESEIQARYPAQIAARLFKAQREIESSIPVGGNEKYAVTIKHNIYITKKPKEATMSVAISKDAEDAAYIFKQTQDMQNACPFPTSKCLDMINQRIQRDGINFINPVAKPEKIHDFNQYHFSLFVKFYNMKSDPKLCYAYQVGHAPQYSYSNRAVDLIYGEIKKDPEHIISILRAKIGK